MESWELLNTNGCSFYDKCRILWQIIDALMRSFVSYKRFLKNLIIIVPKKDQDWVSKWSFISEMDTYPASL